MEIGDLFVAAHIKRADDDGSALESGGNLTIRLELLLLRRKLGSIHKQELGAEQTDRLSIVFERVGNIVRAADVASKNLLDAVSGNSLFAAESLERGLLRSELLSHGGVLGKNVCVGLGNNDAVRTIDDSSHAVAKRRAAVGNGKDRGNLECASDDRGVRCTATGFGNDTGNVFLIDSRRHGRGKVMNDDDGVLGQDGKVDDLNAQKLGKNTGADICDVGGTKTEHLVVHRQEHVLEHGASVDKRLLSAGAAIDGAVDGISHAGILGKNDVAQHDLGLRLAHGGLHMISLSLGLLAENRKRGLVTLLFRSGVGDLLRLERKVRIHSDHDGTDTDALRRIDSLVHSHSSLSSLRVASIQNAGAHTSVDACDIAMNSIVQG